MYGYNQMTKWGVICHRNKVALWLRCNKTKPPMLACYRPIQRQRYKKTKNKAHKIYNSISKTSTNENMAENIKYAKRKYIIHVNH